VRIAFTIVAGVIGLFIAYGYPFVAVLRGGHFGKAVANAWAVLFVFMVFLCFLLPGVITLFSRELGREMFRAWVPEGPAVGAAMIIGWLPPLIAALIGLAVRWLLGIFWPHALARLDSFRRTHEADA
jgi:hypothetical protein